LHITHAIDMLDFGVARGPACDSVRHEMKYQKAIKVTLLPVY
jgi:hypothetical protein